MKIKSPVYPHNVIEVPNDESTDGKIASETTKELANIHSFLTSIHITDRENLSVFGLLMKLEFELMGRPEAMPYLKARNELFKNTK